MAYTLDFQFEPNIDWRRLRAHFAARRHYEIEDYAAFYQNPDTGVGFCFDFQRGRWSPLRKNIATGTFTMPYCRAGFFGLEAEGELTALIAAFAPRIDDPQIHGMSDGPYSGAGFLRGWNFGNALAIRAMLSDSPDRDIPVLPAAVLAEVWRWNYASTADRIRFKDRRFVPHIKLFQRDGRSGTFVVWPSGSPVSLPQVDYVMIGRGFKPSAQSLSLVPWAAVTKALSRAGFDTRKNPIDLEYFHPPEKLECWLASLPLTEIDDMLRLTAEDVIDAETLAAARAAGPLATVDPETLVDPGSSVPP